MARIDQTGVGVVEGGYDTTHLSAAAQDKVWRAEKQADALAYLTRTGNADVAEILGLVEPATPSPRRRQRIGGEQ